MIKDNRPKIELGSTVRIAFNHGYGTQASSLSEDSIGRIITILDNVNWVKIEFPNGEQENFLLKDCTRI